MKMNERILMRLFLIIITLVINTRIQAQNLIKNGDFEQGECPEERSDGHSVCSFWNSIASADYFSECSAGEVNPNNNFVGHQAPYSGIAYAGIYSGTDTQQHNAEILYTELSEPLVKGQKYKLSFWYSLADSSSLISKSLGCAFSETFAYQEINLPLGIGHSPLFELKYALLETDFNSLSDDKSWRLFEQEYVALGGERYLYISGVPADGISCIQRKSNPLKNQAYYYIDKVSLVKQNADGSYPVLASEVHRQTTDEEEYTFSNIYFSTNSYQLHDTSKSNLDTLIKVLNESPAWTVAIQGHTDAIGKEEDNFVLSENRANAVKDYLLSNGIDGKRIEIQPMGSNKPLSSNASEEERAKNRRVEIFLKKD